MIHIDDSDYFHGIENLFFPNYEQDFFNERKQLFLWMQLDPYRTVGQLTFQLVSDSIKMERNNIQKR